METGLYCIYDSLGEKASPPFFADNDDVAVRQYRTLVEDIPPFARVDFKLFHIGAMNIYTMEIVPVEPDEVDTVRRFKAEVENE